MFSPVSFQMCSQTTCQNRFKFRTGLLWHLQGELVKSFEDYRRRIPALSDKNTIRIMKRGATNTKRILGLCKLRICLDLMVPNHQWRLYLGSCWQQIFIGHRSYHCVPLSLTDWVIQSLLFQMTPVFKSENNSLLDAMFVALARVVDYMHGCFIHIFRVFLSFFVKWWNTLFNLLEHKLPERYLVTPFMKGKEGDEVQSMEPSAATWGRVINPSTSQCQRF